MIDAGQKRAEGFAVVDDAADRNAAEADAVIAAFAADQARAPGFAAAVVIGERDLQRGIDRFRTGVAEEHMLKTRGRQRGDAACELEGLGMTELERRQLFDELNKVLDEEYDKILALPPAKKKT